MAKTTIEKITSVEEQIRQLENQRKLLLRQHKEQERKGRTKRLCRRHGLLEKYMPDLMTITDEQFEAFIKKGINTSYGRNILAEIKGKSGTAYTTQAAETAQQDGAPTAQTMSNDTGRGG